MNIKIKDGFKLGFGLQLGMCAGYIVLKLFNKALPPVDGKE